MIIQSKNFNLQQIADSGQCFRMNKVNENKYSLIAYKRYIELEQIDNNTIKLDCDEKEYKEIWHDYFDMEYDYESIYEMLANGDDKFLADAAKFGSGIRILQQEPFEILISFIISQNKNIPAIKSSVESISRMFGQEKQRHSYILHISNSPELSRASLEELKKPNLVIETNMYIMQLI